MRSEIGDGGRRGGCLGDGMAFRPTLFWGAHTLSRGSFRLKRASRALGGEFGLGDGDAKSTGKGELIEPQCLSMKVKQSFGEAAGGDNAGADEEDAQIMAYVQSSLGEVRGHNLRKVK